MKTPLRLVPHIACPPTQTRFLSGQSSYKYASSRSPSVLGKRPRRDVRSADASPRTARDKRHEGPSSFGRRREGTTTAHVAAPGTGFRAESRRMSLEFAEMRREEKQMFPSPTSNKSPST